MDKITDIFVLKLNPANTLREIMLEITDRKFPYNAIHKDDSKLPATANCQFLFFNKSISFIPRRTIIIILNNRKFIPADCS